MSFWMIPNTAQSFRFWLLFIIARNKMEEENHMNNKKSNGFQSKKKKNQSANKRKMKSWNDDSCTTIKFDCPWNEFHQPCDKYCNIIFQLFSRKKSRLMFAFYHIARAQIFIALIVAILSIGKKVWIIRGRY